MLFQKFSKLYLSRYTFIRLFFRVQIVHICEPQLKSEYVSDVTILQFFQWTAQHDVHLFLQNVCGRRLPKMDLTRAFFCPTVDPRYYSLLSFVWEWPSLYSYSHRHRHTHGHHGLSLCKGCYSWLITGIMQTFFVVTTFYILMNVSGLEAYWATFSVQWNFQLKSQIGEFLHLTKSRIWSPMDQSHQKTDLTWLQWFDFLPTYFAGSWRNTLGLMQIVYTMGLRYIKLQVLHAPGMLGTFSRPTTSK